MLIIILSDDVAGARRFADALDEHHTVARIASGPDAVGEVPPEATFVLLPTSPITLRLWTAKLRRTHGEGHRILVGIPRGEARELAHVIAAGADDFLVWPREPEFLSLRLDLLDRQRGVAAPAPVSPAPAPRVAQAAAPTFGAEATCRALLRASRDVVVWLTPDGRIREVHANDPSLLPVAPATLVGKTLGEAFTAPVATRLERGLLAVVSGAPECRLSYTAPAAEGPERSWEITFVRVSDEEVIGVARAASAAPNGDDVADTQADSRRFTTRVTAALPLQIVVYSLDTRRFVYLNRPLDTALGLSVVEALNAGLARFADVVHPDDLPALVAHAGGWDGAEDDVVRGARFRVRRADGRWHPITSREVVFRRAPDGRPLEILAVLEDDTAALAAVAAPKVDPMGDHAALALAGPDDHLYGWSFATGQIESWGQSRLTELASTREDWLAHIHETDRPVVVAAMERHIETGAPYNETIRLRLWDGSWRTCVDRGAVIRDAAGRPSRWVGVCTDITDRVMQLDRLSAEQKMEAVAHLAGGVAQDFNKLLLEIFNQIDLAMSGLAHGSVARSELVGARRAAEQAATLTRQLLAFGRRQTLQPEYISVNDVIGDLIDTLARRLGPNIELSFESSEHLGMVLADPMQIEQILLTLCSRARDAMPDGGSLAILTSNVRARDEWSQLPSKARDTRYVKIRVEDSGPGFPRELLAHVFDPFFAAADGGPRTGLELAMVHGVVDQHEGVCSAENLRQGGAAINLYLPVVERPPARLRRPAAPPRGGDETLLLVDDDELVRNMAARMLRGAGYKILTAADGAEGIATLREHQAEVRLVILDVVMPRMGGRATWEQMSTIAPDMPFIFISGYTMTAQDTDFVQHGGRRFLPKPFNSGQLLREVRSALDA
ncbi:MAG: response regulator [Deltaproteobacteria bacterium]|nr:MAG: response regulator [Deltaproteobacteria bacterium]